MKKNSVTLCLATGFFALAVVQLFFKISEQVLIAFSLSSFFYTLAQSFKNYVDLRKKNDDEAKSSLDTAIQSIDYENTKSDQEAKFREPLDKTDYAGVLRVFNEKGLSNSIGRFFGLDNKVYCSTILALLNGKMHGEIVDALVKYLPTEIPR